jgi:hypothetical protein
MNDSPNIVLRMSVALYELPVALRLLDGIKVFALDILDESELGSRRFVNLAYNRRDRVKSSALGGSPTPFARDNLEPIFGRPQQDWLKNASFRDRLCEFIDRLLAEHHSRLRRVRPNPAEVDFADPALPRRIGGRRGTGVAEQGR